MAFDYNTWKRQYLAHERHRQANSGAPAPMATGRAGGYRPGPSGGATSKGGVVDLTADDDDDVQATGPFSQSALGKRPYEQHQPSSYDHWSRSTFSGGLGFVRPGARVPHVPRSMSSLRPFARRATRRAPTRRSILRCTTRAISKSSPKASGCRIR